jgi:hypothetical protein
MTELEGLWCCQLCGCARDPDDVCVIQYPSRPTARIVCRPCFEREAPAYRPKHLTYHFGIAGHEPVDIVVDEQATPPRYQIGSVSYSALELMSLGNALYKREQGWQLHMERFEDGDP